MFKRVISCFLLFVFLISGTTEMNAVESQQEKVVTLNKINILQGDGSNFNLKGKLKRSEAAAFIVRLLGVEQEVLKDANKYKETNFTDVEPDNWAAVYVGYVAKHKIVNGYGDGTFRPNEYVTEKQFTKMVLGTLGYIQGQDFTWNEVYSFAYEKELYDNIVYTEKTEDSVDYKRQDAINLLYTSLTKSIKEENSRIIDRLIEKKVTTEEIAIKIGIVNKDTVELAIENVDTISEIGIVIKFNEELEKSNLPKVKIYDSNNSEKVVDIKKIEISGSVLTLTTDIQAAGRHYKIEIEELVDMEGNKSNLETEVEAYLSNDISSNHFRVAKVEAVSEKIVKIYFTQPITINIEMPSFYDIYNDNKLWIEGDYSTMTIKKLNSVDNGISIFFKENKGMLDNEDYQIALSSNITSIYGIKLNEGNGEKITFAGNGNGVKTIALNKVIAMDKKTLYVEFDNEVDKNSAENASNYTLKQESNIVNILKVTKIAGKNAVMIGLFQELDEKKFYKLIVNNVYNSFMNQKVNEGELEFVGNAVENVANKIVYVGSADSQTLNVYFEKTPYISTVDNPVYYIITGGGYSGSPKEISYDANYQPNLATLHMVSPLKPNIEYTLTVSAMIKNDILQTPSANLTQKFTVSDVTNPKPAISSAVYIGSDTILVTMTEPIQRSGANISSTNYRLKHKNGNDTSILNCSYVSTLSATEFIMKFDGINSSLDYNLEFTTLTDYSGLGIATTSDSNTASVDFTVR